MKKTLLLTPVLLFASSMLYAQSTTSLTDVAMLLFKNVKTKLTIAEQNQVAAKTGFVLSGNKDQPFAADKDSKEYPFAAFVYPTDMNKDGKEEIFVVFGNTFTSGNAGSSITLYIKNAAGTYMPHLGFPGTIPEALTTSSMSYPDLLIGGPGMEYPVQRWNGKTYVFNRTVKDKDYGKLKKKGIDAMSKTYQESITMK
ncbi:hypothetical protein FAM09_01220 [Niastella caeni]|uniref:VCBS repeat-containing protein n=1 Tax=Niastella caeni TaxID=2569763 RepID=A0A4S8I2C2_9BACT|nr:hypothetical protein [Niastella caeni]THU40764.1 hypothetical protein FAM09_01220 [Niastella caeni]